MSALNAEPHGFVWSRHHSMRSSTQTHNYEADTLCLLPPSTRILSALLCVLLMCSLMAAIFNSLHGNNQGSASFCKRLEEPFRPKFLAPSRLSACLALAHRARCCSITKLRTITSSKLLYLCSLLCSNLALPSLGPGARFINHLPAGNGEKYRQSPDSEIHYHRVWRYFSPLPASKRLMNLTSVEGFCGMEPSRPLQSPLRSTSASSPDG
ncbi:unnamed protein product [Heligmosomoides polygyrus]|uniref:Uncharacterized protein n=1 Tax=Heligmosomoides polygyrus TaxID=6339 RepID=A0A183F7L0_HELPZ|nr:unnamed protein product [Heligmosomoides polygyrus]